MSCLLNAPCLHSLAARHVDLRCVRVCAKPKGFGEVKAPEPQKKKASSQPGMPSKADLKMQTEAIRAAQTYKDSQANVQMGQGPENDDDDVVPAAITDRMLSRILVFSGIPIFVGFLTFPLFWYLKVVKDVELPMGTVYVTSSTIFGIGLLGISYGAMSASWDERMTGSKLGFDEFKANLAAVLGRMDSKK